MIIEFNKEYRHKIFNIYNGIDININNTEKYKYKIAHFIYTKTGLIVQRPIWLIKRLGEVLIKTRLENDNRIQ